MARPTLHFSGDNLHDLIDTLVTAVDMATQDCRPRIIVNGITFEFYDLLKVAALVPDGELETAHKEKVNSVFIRGQRGYRRTAYNLAHRANQIESARAASKSSRSTL